MYSLFMYVVQFGGYDLVIRLIQVCRRDMWAQIAQLLALGSVSNAASMMQKVYARFLKKFEYVLLSAKFRVGAQGDVKQDGGVFLQGMPTQNNVQQQQQQLFQQQQLQQQQLQLQQQQQQQQQHLLQQQQLAPGPFLKSLQNAQPLLSQPVSSPTPDTQDSLSIRSFGGYDFEQLQLAIQRPPFSKMHIGPTNLFHLYMALLSRLPAQTRYALDVLVLFSVENMLQFKPALELLDVIMELLEQKLERVLVACEKRLTYNELILFAKKSNRSLAPLSPPLENSKTKDGETEADLCVMLALLVSNTSFHPENQQLLASHPLTLQILFWTLTMDPSHGKKSHALEHRKHAITLLANIANTPSFAPTEELMIDIIWVCTDYLSMKQKTPGCLIKGYAYHSLETLSKLLLSQQNRTTLELVHHDSKVDLKALCIVLYAHLPLGLETDSAFTLAGWELLLVVLVQITQVMRTLPHSSTVIARLVSLCKPRPPPFDTVRERCFALLKGVYMQTEKESEEDLVQLMMDCSRAGDKWMSVQVGLLLNTLSA